MRLSYTSTSVMEKSKTWQASLKASLAFERLGKETGLEGFSLACLGFLPDSECKSGMYPLNCDLLPADVKPWMRRGWREGIDGTRSVG